MFSLSGRLHFISQLYYVLLTLCMHYKKQKKSNIKSNKVLVHFIYISFSKDVTAVECDQESRWPFRVIKRNCFRWRFVFLGSFLIEQNGDRERGYI